ncbi:MAG: hypothetical protein QF368_15085, partial [SAR202 cluster bacterium]|nr:hypothetical protein [SAR202 cluster bacterium]
SDPEMRPRWRLAYTPYAFFAMTAELSESTSKLDCAGCVGPSHLSFDPTGEKGDKGDIGPKGDPGIQGIQGIQGVKGENGDPGIQGIQGVKGDTGNKGDPGNQGIQGVKGDTGADGANGANGTDGATGPPGPPGPAGIAFSNAFFIEFTNDNVHLVGQISLNAPSAGYVVVQADGMVVWNRYHGNATFQIGIDETSGTFDTNYVTAGGTDGPTTEGNHRFPYSVSRVFKVSAGNKSYFLNAVRFNASGEDPFVVVSSFKAMYFPDALGTANE